ncbi:MAG TPA: heparinase II/III family protein [Gemmatimonadales bacterium]|nr:heparinase II/III family protein [Gemmatimonadales bacterium]
MVTPEELAARRQAIAGSPDLQRLLEHLRERAHPVLERLPAIPEHKALLSVDGGVCGDDGASLTFDPWSPAAHRCPRCGKTWTGERHDRHWARFQHLWLAERAAHLAALAALGGDDAAGERSHEILTGYAERYWRYPNRDNVLGPSRLFFSTYLESLWVCNYLAAAMLLRAAGRLDPAAARAVGQVADEAANLIGDFDEHFSNRQTWNNAALTAIAVWFEDEDLAQRAIEGPTGLVAHLVRGYGRDGMWYEGENYHLFALRGLLTGVGWARLAGVECWADPRLAGRIAAALRAPALTALPDFTFPARKDSRYGISLAQPMYLELWEIGLAKLGTGDRGPETGDLANWLAALYRVRSPAPELFESYLHDAPFASPTPHAARRTRLSWWSLLEMAPELSGDPDAWRPGSILLEAQGLAVLRADGRYASVECGRYGGGHGHPDRLHLTLHAGGVHWLPDPGTGSYVARDLFWYRSTLAHNAPRVDGASQPPGDASCEMFDVVHDWAWVVGRYGDLRRTVVSGPRYVVDVVELVGREDRVLEVPWHVGGRGDVATPGRWEAGQLADEFVTGVERFVPDQAGPIVLEHSAHRAQLTAHWVFDGELLRAEGPGLPGDGKREAFYVIRARGRNLRIVAVLDPHTGEQQTVRTVRASGDVVEVETGTGVERHRFTGRSWEVGGGEGKLALGGSREIEPPFEPLLELEGPTPALGAALRVAAEPALDGTPVGFDPSEPLHLALEDQYRRSEDAYPGPDDLFAVAYAAWDEAALYLAVQVTKPDLCFRPGDAPPLRLENEPDDIHSDGLQVYVAGDRDPDGGGVRSGHVGYLVIPDTNGTLRVRATSDTAGDARGVRGAWRRTDPGYCVTLAVPWPSEVRPHVGGRVAFDLIINEMLPGRLRRAGQLVWSGGDGWVWLRGDRQDPARFGVLELIG